MSVFFNNTNSSDSKLIELEELVQSLQSGVKRLGSFNPKTNVPALPLTPLNENYDSGDYFDIVGLDDGEEYLWNTFTFTNGDHLVVEKVDNENIKWGYINLGKLAKDINYNNNTSGIDAVNVQNALDEIVSNVSTKAINSEVVHLQGSETIDGIKTFGSFPITPESNPTTNYEVANKSYVDNASPTQLSTHDIYVSTAGNDTFNGQVNRKKLTVENALLTVEDNSGNVDIESRNVHIEGGYYTEMLELGTARSRVALIGSADGRTVLKQIKFTENNKQSQVRNIRLENDGVGVGNSGFGIDIQSTLSNYTLTGLSVGGNHASSICINVANGGSGYIAIANCDFNNKIINLENSTIPRFLFINQSANLVINAGTNWAVIVDVNSANILEQSSNNNVFRGNASVNGLLENTTAYNGVLALGALANGFYAVNYDEAGVFSKGDIILIQHPITIVSNKHYNTLNASYYDMQGQRTLHKENGGWVVSAGSGGGVVSAGSGGGGVWEEGDNGKIFYEGGSVGIGTSTPNANAILDLQSTEKGFLPPRMTTAQRDAISTPDSGMTIFNTSINELQIRSAGAWKSLVYKDNTYSKAEIDSLLGKDDWNIDLSGGAISGFIFQDRYVFFGGGALTATGAADFPNLALVGSVAEAKRVMAGVQDDFARYITSYAGENDQAWDQLANANYITAGTHYAPNKLSGLDLGYATDVDGSPSEFFIVPFARDAFNIYFFQMSYNIEGNNYNKRLYFHQGGDGAGLLTTLNQYNGNSDLAGMRWSSSLSPTTGWTIAIKTRFRCKNK